MRTYDAQGRAQIEASADFMRISMKQGGDMGGNSAFVELVIDAEQPVAVRVNQKGNPVIRITGTQELIELLSFIEQVAPQINNNTDPKDLF